MASTQPRSPGTFPTRARSGGRGPSLPVVRAAVASVLAASTLVAAGTPARSAPDAWVRALEERGVLGTNVLWFEQGPEHLPTPPEEYRRSCMASVVTHDLPPTAGYVELRHVDIREQLGLLNDPAAERQGALAEVSAFAAELDRRGLLGAGRAGGTGGAGGETTEAITVGLHALLAASPSLLVAVSVADLVADRRPVNIPGTSEEYPNWRVPLSGPDGRVLSLEEVCADPLADRVMRAARDGRI